jgi:poly-gamma-glutamate capsule biosynthesis protein CapA/YwtB (metallophosphatase superfamily)
MEKLINFLLSLLAVFNSSQITPVKETNIILAGDVMLGRSVMTQSLKINDPSYPFRKVSEKLNQADIVFVNLENPIISNCPSSNSGFKFCADPKMIEGLKFAGVDVVSLANNHTLNYGKEGFAETEKILTENGIKWIGDGNLGIVEKNGIKFGFLGFDFVTLLPKETDYQLITDLKNKVDVLIVMVHWGVEYVSQPTKTQVSIAKELVEVGADVVAGSHPHWVQSTDYIDGKPIFYSLGNFIFDQAWSEETKKGLAIELTYQDSKIINTKLLPIYMKNFVQPEWVQ